MVQFYYSLLLVSCCNLAYESHFVIGKYYWKDHSVYRFGTPHSVRHSRWVLACKPHGELETTIMTHEQQSSLLVVFSHSSL